MGRGDEYKECSHARAFCISQSNCHDTARLGIILVFSLPTIVLLVMQIMGKFLNVVVLFGGFCRLSGSHMEMT